LTSPILPDRLKENFARVSMNTQDLFSTLADSKAVERLMCAQILAALIEANTGVPLPQLVDKATEAVTRIDNEYL
jgi:hypothetical protein